jgi:hypothetical protein
MSDRISLNGTTVNAPNTVALAQVYAEITAGTTTGPHGTSEIRCPSTAVSR